MIRSYISQPYPIFENRWKVIPAISVFVTLFMVLFQPFGLSGYSGTNRELVFAGYGGVTFIVLVINCFFVPLLFKKQFNAAQWKVWKQVVWLSTILFMIGLGNYFYTLLFFTSMAGLYQFMLFQFFTVAVGVIPITIITVIKQNVLLAKNLKAAGDLNTGLKDTHQTAGETIILTAESGKDKLEIALSNLLYIESAGNYIQVFYTETGKLKSGLLRNTLKNTETQLIQYPAIFKCHRAFLVNVNNIVRVKGNSQGLQLLLHHTETEIPVSRNFQKDLKDMLSPREN